MTNKEQKWLDEVYDKNNSELYDAWDNYHEQVIEGLGWKCHTIAAKWIADNFPEGTEVADIGCGNGQVGLGLAEHDYKIDGYDLNLKMLERFIATNYRSISKHDITEKALPKKYKCITAIGVLTKGHVNSIAAEHLANSLTNNGLLFCSMSKHDGDWFYDGGWNAQSYLDVVNITPVHSLTTPEGIKTYHNMVIWRKKARS